jgi:hypothetical protein
MSQLNNLNIELSNSLLSCPKCVKVLKYYDYLSHIEICTVNNENILDYDMETNYDEDEENADEININNESNNNNFYYNTNINYNINYDTYSRMVSENLYNSNLDRNFNNPTTNTTNTTNTNVNDISDNIGLGIENLSLYSTKIPINNDSYCVICMNTNIYNEDNTFYLMKCLHSFCDDCSRKWFDFKPTCPLCKTNMRKI